MEGWTVQERRNVEIAREMYERVIARFDPTDIDRYIAPDYIQHSSMAASGRDGLRDFLVAARRDFPQPDIQIVRAFADGDHVIFHVRGRLAPDQPEAAVVDIFRMADDMIQEHWEVLQQLPADVPHANGIF